MNKDLPVVFTISEYMRFGDTTMCYSIKTKNPNFLDENIECAYQNELFMIMRDITEAINRHNIAVLFEVD